MGSFNFLLEVAYCSMVYINLMLCLSIVGCIYALICTLQRRILFLMDSSLWHSTMYIITYMNWTQWMLDCHSHMDFRSIVSCYRLYTWVATMKRMILVERIKQFTNIPSEVEWVKKEGTPPPNFPTYGSLEVRR